MKNLMIEQINVAKDVNVEVASITGKISKKGVITGETKNGTQWSKVTLSVGSTDYDVKHAEFVMNLKNTKLARNGEKADKYPLLFVDAIAYGKQAEFLEKNLAAGDTVRVLGRASTNEYNGKVNLSVTISGFEKDFSKSDEANVTPPISDDDMDGVDW